MYDLYDREYGLCPKNGRSALASIAFNESEDFTTGGLLTDITREYVLKGVGDTYNISLLEFLELPRDIIEALLEVTEEESVKKQRMLTNIENELTKK